MCSDVPPASLALSGILDLKGMNRGPQLRNPKKIEEFSRSIKSHVDMSLSFSL